MENFNLALFNLAINFNNGQKKVKLKSILKKVGVVVLAEYWVVKSTDGTTPEHVEFLTVEGYKISVQEIGCAFVATIESMFPVAVGCVPIEDTHESVVNDCFQFEDAIIGTKVRESSTGDWFLVIDRNRLTREIFVQDIHDEEYSFFVSQLNGLRLSL